MSFIPLPYRVIFVLLWNSVFPHLYCAYVPVSMFVSMLWFFSDCREGKYVSNLSIKFVRDWLSRWIGGAIVIQGDLRLIESKPKVSFGGSIGRLRRSLNLIGGEAWSVSEHCEQESKSTFKARSVVHLVKRL